MERKTSRLSKLVFKIIKALIRLFYGKIAVVGAERLECSDTVIVANHAQTNGPIIGELFMPENCYIWCAGEMMSTKDVPRYAFADFWSGKPALTKPFYKLLSYLIAPIASCIFNNARTIAVYHDMRILSTFRSSADALKNGKNILIFPEKHETYNNILNAFQENFIDLARVYYKKTGRELTFLPMYIAPSMRCAYVGEGTVFDSSKSIDSERERISKYLSEAITDIARALPEHTVIPYPNIPRRNYLTNKDINEVPNEKARR